MQNQFNNENTIAADSAENPLQAIDYTAPNASELFVQQLKETGFGVLKNHPISTELVKSIYKNWEAWYKSEGKDAYAYKNDTQDGFFSSEISEKAKGASVKDIKEYFHYYPWGQCPPELKEEIQTYYDRANEFAIELLGWVEKYSPKEVSENYSEKLSNMIVGSDQTLLRILHYPPLKENEEPAAIRAAAHEDINLITILPAANEPGLQVLSKEGKWINVPCDFGTIIINNGDMLQEASGKYFPSTTHRVVNPGTNSNVSRISLPLFLHPRPNVKLSEKYPTARSYLEERLIELGVFKKKEE